MNRVTTGVVGGAIGACRGVFLVLALYLALGWLSMFAYDESAFPLTYRIRIHLLSAHLFLAAGFVCAAAVLGMVRDWMALRLAEPDLRQTLGRWCRGSLLAFAVATFGGLAALGTYLLRGTPTRMADGLPSMRPSSEFLFDVLSSRPTIHVRTNAQGFRDREWAPKASGEGPRVLLLGDSIVFGSGITRQEGTLAPRLQAALEGTGAQVFNLSLNGLNFRQEVDLLERHVSTIRPDLVVVVHNPQNDLMPVLPYYLHPTLSLVFMPAMLEWIYALDWWIRQHPLSEVPGRLDWFQEDLARLARLADGQGFDVLFTYLSNRCPPAYHRDPPPTQRLFLFANLPTLQDHPDLTFPNDFHPNPAGVDRMALDLAPLVARVLAEGGAWRGVPGHGSMAESFARDCLGRGWETPDGR